MSGDLQWMEPVLAMTLPSIRQKVARLCAVKGVSHLYDEALSEALFAACRNDYNPGRASFETYVVNRAKWWLGDLFSQGEPIEIPVVFTDDFPEEPGEMPAPAVEIVVFEDYSMPAWYKALWLALDSQERQALVYMLLAASQNAKYTYRELGGVLGVSHVTAGNVIKQVRCKTERSIRWTRALSRLVDGWADTATFRGG